MPDALSLSFSGWHPANVRRVRRALDTSLRNEEIRAAYRGRPAGTSQGDAIEALALKHCLSEDAVQRIVWPR